MRPIPSHPPRGVVLIVVLVMLVVIGLASVGTMRQSLSSDTVTQNLRSEALAQEAAQIALRHCEAGIVRTTVPLDIKAYQATAHWDNRNNWDAAAGTSAPVTLTREDVASAEASFTPTRLPQCMAEYSSVGNGQSVVIVTARGFSPDHEANNTGETIRGSVVWLQSTLRIQR